MKINIPKSEKTSAKQELKAKLDNIKKKSNVTNSDLKVLLEAVLEKLDKN